MVNTLRIEENYSARFEESWSAVDKRLPVRSLGFSGCGLRAGERTLIG